MAKDEKKESEKAKIEDQNKSGANWFFWIAGLSFINSILFLSFGKWNYNVGLGITRLVDVTGMTLVNAFENSGYVVACMLNMIVSGIFALFGILARKKCNWAFIVGMSFYALDALVFLLVQDYVGVGFHVFVLFLIAGGFKTNRMLREGATFFAV